MMSSVRPASAIAAALLHVRPMVSSIMYPHVRMSSIQKKFNHHNGIHRYEKERDKKPYSLSHKVIHLLFI
jgi:hypothetical protein